MYNFFSAYKASIEKQQLLEHKNNPDRSTSVIGLFPKKEEPNKTDFVKKSQLASAEYNKSISQVIGLCNTSETDSNNETDTSYTAS